MSKQTKAAPSKTLVEEVFALAREMGWTHLCPQEKNLIDVIRQTTYHGRNMIIETAYAMHKRYPWDYGDSSPKNTSPAMYLDNKVFFTK